MNTGLAKRYTGMTSHFCAKLPIETTVACPSMIEQIPLIEKTKKIRVGIFNDSATSNLSVVGAFIEAAKTDCEVWYFGKAPLKSWMKPDFVVEEIPEAEWGIYISSLDVVLLCMSAALVRNLDDFTNYNVTPLNDFGSNGHRWRHCYKPDAEGLPLENWLRNFQRN
jgi:hypothetical protein